MIKTQNLTKLYTTEDIETTALNDINITIEEGEFVAIMGPSGCGKSTLLNVLGLLDVPNTGHYFFRNQDVTTLNEKERTSLRKSNIGFIFQNFNLIDELTVFENIELPLQYQGISADERKKKVNEIMEQFEIAHRGGHFPLQLSGGQQQRAAICRAIVGNQKIIFADEPTGNLDSKNGQEVMKMLTELNMTGTTIVMVTHSDIDSGYAGRIIQLVDGTVRTS
jgi:putative ABC transport system ATP-binding protein